MDHSILAFDYGDKRIGVAIANSIARFAKPLTTLANNAQVFEQINQIIKKNNVKELAVGLPRNMKGQETAQSKACRNFARQLAKSSGLKVEMVDESLTSVLSEEELAKGGKVYEKGKVDMLAASAILQEYLNV